MKTIILVVILHFCIPAFSQTFKFAFLSDTHIGVKNAEEDLRRSVMDINADTSLKFVIISGDITETGSDQELLTAKAILSEVKIPVYILTGNHDLNWSPTGGEAFRALLGDGRFAFEHEGVLFIGTNSGPNMLHKSPGQVPREDLVWLDSVLRQSKKNVPIVYVNHYPQESSQQNWYEAMDRLKKKNIQLILVGHGHLNNKFNFEGIPGIMGRSNLRAADTTGGYTLVHFSNGNVSFAERKPLTSFRHVWADVQLREHSFDTLDYPRPSYAVNKTYSHVKVLWQRMEDYDIGAEIVGNGDFILATNTGGWVYALNKKDGTKKWGFRTNGKIYSAPVVADGYVIVASTDSCIYSLRASDGKLAWKYKTQKPIVASPVAVGGILYIGSSDGHFRALDNKKGTLLWDFAQIKDFIITKPLFYNGKIYFGSWGSEFYALEAFTGRLSWKWTDTSFNRMHAPAGCRPVGAGGKVFIVAPDQFMTAFDADNGRVVWRKKMPSIRVRESIGLSKDSLELYVKTTDGKLFAVSATEPDMLSTWNLNLQTGYDVSPGPAIDNGSLIFVSSNSGTITAIDKTKQKIAWRYKVSNSLVTGIMPLGDQKLVVSTVDGKITCLQF